MLMLLLLPLPLPLPGVAILVGRESAMTGAFVARRRPACAAKADPAGLECWRIRSRHRSVPVRERGLCGAA